jgi:hypothetical protein
VARLLAEAGVRDIMGWTEARMLSRYQHVVDELRRDAADRRRRTNKASDPENTRSEAKP